MNYIIVVQPACNNVDLQLLKKIFECFGSFTVLSCASLSKRLNLPPCSGQACSLF